MSGRSFQTRQTIAVLDADPDLAAAVDEPERGVAQREAVAVVLKLEGPRWDPSPICRTAKDGWLGLLLIDGLMMRAVTFVRRQACELLGQGDLIRPWDADREYDLLPITVDWRAQRGTCLAVLDTCFALRISRWPGNTSELVARVAHRARHLALTQSVTHLPRANGRLMILFWLLAERWGKVGMDGSTCSCRSRMKSSQCWSD